MTTNERMTMNRIHFLRATWCDIILAESGGQFGLIDTGYAEDSERIFAYLDQLGIRRLEWILITHFHRDHYGSLPALLKKIPVGRVYMKKYSGLNATDSSGRKATAEYNESELARCESMCTLAGSVSELTVIDGSTDRVRLGEFEFRLFGTTDAIREMHDDPESPYSGQIRFGENTNSVALYAEVNGTTVYLGGDAKNEALEVPRYDRQNTQYARAVGKPIDLYKVPHHGCGSLFGEEVLNILRPRYSVVTNWEMTLNRRFTENRDRLLSARPGARVLCTDRCGYVFTLGADGDISWEEADRVPDIRTEEVAQEEMEEFQKIRTQHLSEDEMIPDGETGPEAGASAGDPGKESRAVWFIREGVRIGAACYEIDRESGECRIPDFWVFRPCRSHGAGHFCYEALETRCRGEGATAFLVRSDRPAVIRFWKAFGFEMNESGEERSLRYSVK